MRSRPIERERELKSELARLDTAVMSIERQLAARGDTDVGDRLMRVEQLPRTCTRFGRDPR